MLVSARPSQRIGTTSQSRPSSAAPSKDESIERQSGLTGLISHLEKHLGAPKGPHIDAINRTATGHFSTAWTQGLASAAHQLVGDEAEPVFDLVDQAGTARGEMHVEAGDLLTRSCPDHADVEIVGDRGVDLGLELDRPVLSNPQTF